MSKREQVILAVKALVEAAVPELIVTRNPDDEDEGDQVALYDGDPGEPEVDFSPTRYNYRHPIPIVVLGYEDAAGGREATVDGILTRIGEAASADPTLGGLVEYLDAAAPTAEDVRVFGALTGRALSALLIPHYWTIHPLL